MARIDLVDLAHSYNGNDAAPESFALKPVTMTWRQGGAYALLGPSGCGKTTLLNLIAGIIPVTEGRITIDGRIVSGPGPERAYVFQHHALFPWMTVQDNIGSVPRLLGWSKGRIRERAAELLELVGLDPQSDLNRYPAQFSGGQQQRIGVARAMAADPPIMLMDEPFGAIDPIARERLQNDTVRIEEHAREL